MIFINHNSTVALVLLPTSAYQRPGPNTWTVSRPTNFYFSSIPTQPGKSPSSIPPEPSPPPHASYPNPLHHRLPPHLSPQYFGYPHTSIMNKIVCLRFSSLPPSSATSHSTYTKVDLLPSAYNLISTMLDVSGITPLSLGRTNKQKQDFTTCLLQGYIRKLATALNWHMTFPSLFFCTIRRTPSLA